jgi:hypothetical protein
MKTRVRMAGALWLAVLSASGCKPRNTVKLAWDPPNPVPKGYRILLDDQVVQDIPPPPMDRACSCPTVSVTVPPGPHKLTVVAYNDSGASAPSAVTFVK